MTIDPIRFKLRMPSEEHQGEALSIFSEFVTPEYSVHYSYNNLVSCSYDPNAKSSVPNDGISGRLEGFQPIIYTVDFENLGNDTAKKVVVRDKISLDHELSSFEFLESSHPCKHFITAHREIWFVFDPIHLPPSSTDSIKGRGQLKFKLTPANHLQNWDIVTNTAQIFFDKNAPIVTNETHNLFNHYNTRNQSEEIIRNAYLSYTKIFPQPFANKIKVEIPYFYWLKDELSWKLYNSLGMYVTEGVFSHTVNEIELFHLTDGLYWLIIDYNGKWSQTKKLIKITD